MPITGSSCMVAMFVQQKDLYANYALSRICVIIIISKDIVTFNILIIYTKIVQITLNIL